MGLLINGTDTSPKPDSSSAFLDALLSMSSDSDFYAGKSVLRNPDVYSAVTTISNTIAACPFISNTPLISKMLNNPDASNVRSGFNFWSSVLTNLLINGNSFALIENGGHALKFVENSQMTVTIDDTTGNVHYYYSPNMQTTQEIAPSSILHFKILSMNGIVGVSPLYALRDSLDLQSIGTQTLKNVFQSGIHGMLNVSKTDLSDSAKENLRQNFQKIASSGVGVSDDSIKFEQISVDEGLLKAIQTNNLASEKVASVFGIPSEMIGLENSHSSVSQSLKVMFLQGLTPFFGAIQSELNNKLPGYEIEQDKSKILPASFADKAKTVVSLVENGIMMPCEARQTLNIDKPSDNDNEALNRFYGSLNYSQLDNLSENDYNKANASKYSNDNTDTNEEGNNDSK
ncbi:phage portal protein [Lentilactobacillus kefiri]|uniref:phage portal protein n=4 Tax=Bacilli TaxID=91061 RepID=UPI000BA6529F|nr:phage portal protein [Lentilactobacillus kefiri]PAK81006.1 phage portal protein [Lentilactobacillus kefiri]PAL05327.1 phage portal protein [Lentilactobacillus kefiri]